MTKRRIVLALTAAVAVGVAFAAGWVAHRPPSMVVSALPTWAVEFDARLDPADGVWAPMRWSVGGEPWAVGFDGPTGTVVITRQLDDDDADMPIEARMTTGATVHHWRIVGQVTGDSTAVDLYRGAERVASGTEVVVGTR